MGLRDDERGQAVQVGAVLLFAILIVAFSTYQAAIIPADNRRVEFNHNQEVQDQLADLRNAVLGTADSTRSQSVTIGLGTQYPSRTLGLNPPPPGGSLRTVGTADPLVNFTIENAVAANDETADLWDGTPRNYSTGAVRYAPTYHEYREAPTTTYEHSVLYNRFSSANELVLANQSMIDGDRISLVALNGSLDRASSRSTTVDVRPISSSTETILIDEQSASEPINLSFTSLRDADAWNRTFGNDTDVTVGQSPSPAGSDYHRIHVTLDGDGPYRLAMTKAAVGTGATAEDPAYLTTVDGDGASVEKGNSQAVTLAVRDAYNNPVGGVTVASAIDGTATTDGDGRVTFTYDTTGVGPGTQQLDFTIQDPGVLSGGTFDGSTPENATADVTVTEPADGGGSGAYALAWTNPDNESANGGGLSNCDDQRCTWDVGASPGSSLALNATLRPPFEGVALNFNANDSSVATVSSSSGTTGSDGAAMTDLEANENGTVSVLAAGNDVSDLITINVTGVASDPGPPGSLAYDDADQDEQYDQGETTYTRSELEAGLNDGGVDLVIPADVGTVSSSSVSISTNSITSSVDMEATNGNLELTASGGDLDLGGGSVSAANGDVTLSASGTALLDGASVETTNGAVSVDGGPVSAVNAELRAQNNDLSLSSSGELDATGATLTSTTGDVGLTSNGDMRLNSTELSATNGAATADLGGGNQVLYVQDAVIEDGDDTLEYSPNGVDVVGDPASGSVN